MGDRRQGCDSEPEAALHSSACMGLPRAHRGSEVCAAAPSPGRKGKGHREGVREKASDPTASGTRHRLWAKGYLEGTCFCHLTRLSSQKAPGFICPSHAHAYTETQACGRSSTRDLRVHQSLQNSPAWCPCAAIKNLSPGRTVSPGSHTGWCQLKPRAPNCPPSGLSSTPRPWAHQEWHASVLTTAQPSCSNQDGHWYRVRVLEAPEAAFWLVDLGQVLGVLERAGWGGQGAFGLFGSSYWPTGISVSTRLGAVAYACNPSIWRG